MGLRALISVSDKTGIVELVKGLHAHGVTILSTGGTAKSIRDAGVPCTDVSEYTQSPEVMDGRVKTLHPRVHGGILMRDTAADRDQLTNLLGGEPIDLVLGQVDPSSKSAASASGPVAPLERPRAACRFKGTCRRDPDRAPSPPRPGYR